MDGYHGTYYGNEIDEAVGKALNPDTTPTADSTALITSGAVHAAVGAGVAVIEYTSDAQALWTAVNSAFAAKKAVFIRVPSGVVSVGGVAYLMLFSLVRYFAYPVNLNTERYRYDFNGVFDSDTVFTFGVSKSRNWSTMAESYTIHDFAVTDQATKSYVDTGLAGKQDTLTFDDEPTENSNNPVKSGGIYDAIQAGGATALGAYPTDTITDADVASFSDGADNIPVKSFTGSIVPIQDLHGQSAPYPAGGGKNLFDESLLVNMTGWAKDSNGFYYGSSSQLQTDYGNNTDGFIPATKFKANTQYTFTATSKVADEAKYVNFRFYYTDNTYSGIALAHTTTAQTISATSDAGNTVFKIVAGYVSGYGTVYIKDVQVEEGATPTSFAPYSNVCPISGWAGANIGVTGGNVWDEEWELGTFNTDGSEAASTTQIRAKNYIPVIGGTKYLFHAGAERVSRIYWYDANKGFIEQVVNQYSANYVSTAPETAKFMRFGLPVAYGTTYNNNVSVNVPYTDTNYHAYTGNEVIPISWQTEAGTVYGGTLNVTTGLLTVTHAIIDLGSLSYTKTGANLFRVGWADKLSGIGTLVCSQYKYQAGGGFQTADGCIGDSSNSSYLKQIFINDSARYNDTPKQFAQNMTGVKLVYPLQTVSTYQLTPTQVQTLLGSNNIFCDCGSIAELTYRADTALYIQKLINGGTVSTLSTASPTPTLSLNDRIGDSPTLAEAVSFPSAEPTELTEDPDVAADEPSEDDTEEAMEE